MKKLILGLAAVAVIGLVAAPAMAATEWNFGASLRYSTFWNEVDGGAKRGPNNPMGDLEGGGKLLKNDGELDWATQGNSRIKMFMKSDNLQGFIEFGYNSNTGSVTTREYWGKYNFGQGWYIQIGQAHQLFNIPGWSNQVGLNDLNMVSMGVSFRPPTDKIILGYGGFAFALAKPETNTNGLSEAASGIKNHTWMANSDKDTYLPQIQASYAYNADTWNFKLAGAFQTYTINDIAGTNKDKSINSWLIDAKAKVFFGPLYIGGTASVGQNWANANWNSTAGALKAKYMPGKGGNLADAGYWLSSTNKVKNTTSAMGAIIAGYRLTEALKFEAGAGIRYDDNNTWRDESIMFNVYLNAAYTVAPGFTITPEIGYMDFGKEIVAKGAAKGKDAGYMWYAGAKWQMDF